jgi:hypothetical protein
MGGIYDVFDGHFTEDSDAKTRFGEQRTVL